MTFVVLTFPGRKPNTALSPNARRTGKVWSQKQATDMERATALTDIRRELALHRPKGALNIGATRHLPSKPWALRWTVHYKTYRAPDEDSLASMLKPWQDVLAAECGIGDGPQVIPEATYRVELNSALAPCMVLRIERAK